MGQPYVGECRLVGFSFAPVGWNFCNGTTLPIAENNALFTLIGTTYGGDGQTTFLLPNLQGRVPVHQGSGFPIGAIAGTESVTLTTAQMPIHNHQSIAGTGAGGSNSPQGKLPASNANTLLYLIPSIVDTPMNNAMIPNVGGNQPHENMQPYLVMNWIISLFGVFPTPN